MLRPEDKSPELSASQTLKGQMHTGLLFGTLVSEAEVCKKLGLPRATLKRLVKQGDLPGLKLGGKWRFNLEAVQYRLSQMAAMTFEERCKECEDAAGRLDEEERIQAERDAEVPY